MALVRNDDQIKIEPGIYDNIDNETYHNGPGISRSGIMIFKNESPYDYWYWYLNGNRKKQKTTPSKELGAALHPYILEPHLFDRDFTYEDRKLDGRKKEDKIYRQEFAKKNADKTILTFDVYEKMRLMIESINRNSLSMELIKNAQCERSIYWNDPDTNILCKARPDILHLNAGIVADLKSTADLSPYLFERSIYNYGYHVQAAMIREGVYQLTGQIINEFLYICVKNLEPFQTVNYKLRVNLIDQGMQEFKTQLVKYKECLQKNIWPGHEDLQELPLIR